MFDYKVIQSFNDLELCVYNYIIENGKNVLDMRIIDIANNTHVSTTTVLRFCRKCNCSGYSEFKVKYKLYLEQQKEDFVAGDIDEIMNQLVKYKDKKFQDKIDSIVSLINESKMALWVGTGTSGIICRYGARYLSGIGKFSLPIDDPYFQLEGDIFDNCLVIALSVSGEVDQSIRLVHSLKSRNCKIISITNRENCTLAKISDFNVSYYVPYDKHNTNDMTTQIPVVYIIESLGKRLLELQNNSI